MNRSTVPQLRAEDEDIAPRLMSDAGYAEKIAYDTVDDLVAAHPDLQRAFWQWWQTGDLNDDPEIEGYTAARLVREHSMKPTGAFVPLDFIRREPQRALSALRRGHD